MIAALKRLSPACWPRKGRPVIAALNLLSLACLLAAAPARALDIEALSRQIGFDQRLGDGVPREAVLRDESGRAVRLGQFLGGPPVVLVLGYFRCPNVCSTAMTTVLQALSATGLDAGRGFQLVAVSIDPRETAAIAAASRAAWLRAYDRPGAGQGVHFLTGSEGDVGAVARAVGFRYAYDSRLDQFAHPAGLVLLTPAGQISRYLLGFDYGARDLRLGLVEASGGRIGSLADHVLLLCYGYDPHAGRYTTAVWKLLRAGGIATTLGLGVLMLRLQRRGPRAAAASGRTGDRPAGNAAALAADAAPRAAKADR